MVSAAERSGAKSNQMAPWQRGRMCLRARFNQEFPIFAGFHTTTFFDFTPLRFALRLHPSTSAFASLSLRSGLRSGHAQGYAQNDVAYKPAQLRCTQNDVYLKDIYIKNIKNNDN
jgi:hypothetical protein